MDMVENLGNEENCFNKKRSRTEILSINMLDKKQREQATNHFYS